jgi:hypothetical protein
MTGLDITRQRLLNQHIAEPLLNKPEEVVAWLVAVQAQDYPGAKWGLGLRLQGATDHEVEQAFASGAILRTHVMRPTWHFVTPDDIRWLLALTAPRVHAANASRYRKLELDGAFFRRCDTAVRRVLQGGNQLTRDELAALLRKSGLATGGGLRMGYILMRAELEGVICSGPRRGKQFTYALLEERVPNSRALDRDEALAELARRYFVTRGPATVHDFAKWSGLTLADARAGLEATSTQLRREVVDGQTYWFSVGGRSELDFSSGACLLSIYDEYISSYKGRSTAVDEVTSARLRAMGNALTGIIVVDGRIVGTWKRALKKDAVVIEVNRLSRLTVAANRAIAAAAHRYGVFLGLPARLAA